MVRHVRLPRELLPQIEINSNHLVFALSNEPLIAPREARNLGTGRKPMKLVVVPQ